MHKRNENGKKYHGDWQEGSVILQKLEGPVGQGSIDAKLLLTHTPPFKSNGLPRLPPCGGKFFSGSRNQPRIFNLVSFDNALNISM